tara:strand:+ start:780 stop:1289 length:510 start_codon:yes stop_codon:yes gene_type:complete
MNKIIIISATSFSNYKLSIKIKKIIDNLNVDCEILNLEDYNLPLFTAKKYNENKNNIKIEINELTSKLIESKGIIVCAPEYNGSIPPIITNCISWISISTDYWRDAFTNKIGLIATSSGGDAIKYNIAMKNQLEHLGVVVVPRIIGISSNKKFNSKSSEKILLQFVNLL